MSGGRSSLTSGFSRFGKLFFGGIGGLSAVVLAVGLTGERGARRAVEQPAAKPEAAAIAPATPRPQADESPPAPAPGRVVQREPLPPRNVGTRPLAIGGPPRADQYKPVESPPQADAFRSGDVSAAVSSDRATSGSRSVRVIAIDRQAHEVQTATAPLEVPGLSDGDSTTEPARTAEAVPPNAPSARQDESPALSYGNEGTGQPANGASSSAAALPPAAPPVAARPEEAERRTAPLPPRTRSARRGEADEDAEVVPTPRPFRARASRLEPEEAAPAARPAPRPPFKLRPVTRQETPHQEAARQETVRQETRQDTRHEARQAALRPPAPVPSVVRKIPTEPIPNLEQAYRRMRSEVQESARRPVPHRSRVALGQPRPQMSPPRPEPKLDSRVESPPPGQRLVVMHLRTYRGPDGELVDVLYRRRPPAQEPRFAEEPRFYAGSPGPSRGGVLDWINR